MIDWGVRAPKPSVLNHDLAKHHKARRTELAIQVSKSSIQIRHDIADLKQRSRQRTTGHVLTAPSLCTVQERRYFGGLNSGVASP